MFWLLASPERGRFVEQNTVNEILYSAGLGGVGGGLGKAVQTMGQARRAYNAGLAAGLSQGLSAPAAHALRRNLGAQLKATTPGSSLIYLRNYIKYGDKLGPKFNPWKHFDPVRTLTNTNGLANHLGYLPARGLPLAGAAGAAIFEPVEDDLDCQCSY